MSEKIKLSGQALKDFQKIRAYLSANPGKGALETLKACDVAYSAETLKYCKHPELYDDGSVPEVKSEPQSVATPDPSEVAETKAESAPEKPALDPAASIQLHRIGNAFSNREGVDESEEESESHSETEDRSDFSNDEKKAETSAAANSPAEVKPDLPAADEEAQSDTEDAFEDQSEDVSEEDLNLDEVTNSEIAKQIGAADTADPQEPEISKIVDDVANDDSADAQADTAPLSFKERMKSLFVKKNKAATKRSKAQKVKSKGKGKVQKDPDDSDLRSDMKRAHGKIDNPYINASTAYRSRLTALSVQIPWLKAGIITLGLLALGIYAQNIYVTSQSRIIPYVMTVDSHGFAVASGTAKPLAYNGKGDRLLTGTTSPNKTALGMGNNIDERVIRAALTDFIAKMRDVTPDVQILRDNIKTCYSMIGDRDPSGDTLDKWFSGEDPDTGGKNPLVRAEKEIVHVRFTSALSLTANTMQVEWIEVTRDRDGNRLIPDKQMRANITWYAGQLKDDIEQIQRNPFGIYIKEFHITSLSVPGASDETGGHIDAEDGSDTTETE
ncbi:MAG: VirB8/TrbF family protein [Succinatimonas hippei]|nr:VirB8/TrbF family protein [Succinatimonas hippei]